jgi:hypothetical protein
MYLCAKNIEVPVPCNEKKYSLFSQGMNLLMMLLWK